MTLDERNLIILYLHREKNWTATKAGKEFNLAPGTIRTYCYKLDNPDNRRLGEKLYLQYYEARETVIQNKKVPCAYICEMYDSNGNFLFGKIGYSGNYAQRVKQHLQNKNYNCSEVRTKKLFMFDNEEIALSFENMLRKYYKQKLGIDKFIRRDRFNSHIGTKDEINFLLQKMEKLINAFE